MQKQLRCIIIDDEEGTHLVIQHYIQNITTLQLVASFYNTIEAMDYLHNNVVDVAFLDINMPGMTGLEMLDAMSHPPLVVLTTAYSEYALASYNYSVVVDYLVKPISLPRFMACVDKVLSRFRVPHTSTVMTVPDQINHLIVKTDGQIVKINFEAIVFIQSWGNYIKIHTDTSVYVTAMTTQEVEEKLDKSRFKRIHKSYIIAINRLQSIKGNQAYLSTGISLPIGNIYRRELLGFFR